MKYIQKMCADSFADGMIQKAKHKEVDKRVID